MRELVGSELPFVSVGLNDLSAIRNVILVYLAYARRSIPPSQQRDDRIRLLGALHQRLAVSPQARPVGPILLMEEEIRALDEAIGVFVAFVRNKVSPSRERDETLSDLDRLRLALLAMLAPTAQA